MGSLGPAYGIPQSVANSAYGRRTPDWAAAQTYVVGELVVNGGLIYRTTTAHTSTGSFDAAKFALVSDIAFDTDGVPYLTIST